MTMKDTDLRVVHWHENGKDTFAVHQVYYNNNGKPERISKEPVSMSTDNLETLKDQQFHIAGAFLQEILPGHLYKSSLSSTKSVMESFFPKKD